MAVLVTLPSTAAFKAFVMACLGRMIVSVGPEGSLFFLGISIVLFKAVHLVSIIGNMGTFNKSFAQVSCPIVNVNVNKPSLKTSSKSHRHFQLTVI